MGSAPDAYRCSAEVQIRQRRRRFRLLVSDARATMGLSPPRRAWQAPGTLNQRLKGGAALRVTALLFWAPRTCSHVLFYMHHEIDARMDCAQHSGPRI